MIILDAALRPAELKTVGEIIAAAEFVDGATTAGSRARRVKNNLQIKMTKDQALSLNTLVRNALMRDPEFQRYTLPKRIAPAILSRYRVGMAYGRHVDDALMHPDNIDLRTDLSLTIFLNDPGEYDGGELIIEGSTAEEAVKLPRGGAVVYQASSLHRVSPVTRGERLAAVTWVQSYVRDAGKRELLADLAAARDCLVAQPGETFTDAADRSCRAYSNLLRRWAEF